MGGSEASFAYDANGNRTSYDGGTGPDLLAYAPFSNRLASIAAESLQHDAAGNRTSDRNGDRTFSYNQAGRLYEVAEFGTPVATYGLNALGQRVRKTAGTDDVTYIYDLFGNLIAEHTSLGAELRDYVWLDSAPVAQVDVGEQFSYLHFDHLTTPRLASDDSQTVTWRWDSDAFGTSLAEEDPDADGNITVVYLRFPGQYYDQETGFHYNYYRTYDPSTGRYLESDPIGLAGGLNTYSYVDGNPLSFIDPLGLSKFDKLFGLPKRFWQWYHRNEKRPGDPDLDRETAEELYEQWKKDGKPGPDNKSNRGSDLLQWFTHPAIELACAVEPCNPYCKGLGYECPYADIYICETET